MKLVKYGMASGSLSLCIPQCSLFQVSQGIGRTPYEALFGGKPKGSFKGLNLENEVTEAINTEEDLERILNDNKSLEEEETGDNFMGIFLS